MRGATTLIPLTLASLCASAQVAAQPAPRAVIRAAAHAPVIAPARAPTPAQTRAADRTRAHRLGLGTMRAADTLLHQRPDATWIAAARGRATRAYLWPVPDGIATQGFHAQAGRHQALDIGAHCGTPIRAAHAGLVGFSALHGNSGNMVVLVHPGGWVTAYAHARRTLVAPGALVRRGQVIAEVGDTGDAHGCHVHFIVARNGRRLDPEQYVTGRPRGSSGRRTARR